MSDTTNTGEQPGEQQQEPGTGEGEQQPEAPTVESLTEALEALKAESRKWEGRAKENFDARQSLDGLTAEHETVKAALSDAETRATDAETRASNAEAALARYQIVAEFGLSADDAKTLASIEDEDTLRALAERLAGPSGPRPDPKQGNRRDNAQMTNADKFADVVEGLLNR